MKQVFYKGLLALTIAFGITSCDKNELPDAPTVGVVVNDEYSKVSFEETGISIAPIKGESKSNVASKNASEFGALGHFYGSGPQNLIITDAAGEQVYEGAYTPNDITSLVPATIILANGVYDVTTSNSVNSQATVLGYLPYTSTAEVNLDESQRVELQATLLRGFVIVDATSDLTEGGERIQSVTLSSGELSGNLILDDREGANDFYGYLIGGEYNVSIAYTRDSVSGVATGTVMIANGVAITLDPILQADIAPEPVITMRSETRTVTGTEAGLPSPRSINSESDDDIFDDISRTIETIFTTTDGTEDDGVDEEPSAWTVTINRSELGVDVTPGDVVDGDADPVDTYTYTEFSGAPAAVLSSGVSVVSTSTAASDVAMVTRTTTTPQFSTVAAHTLTREATIVQNGDLDSPAPATLALTKDVAEDVTTLTALVATEQVANPIYVAVVADTADSGVWALNADGSAAVWVITQGGNALDVEAPAPAAAPGADLLTAGKQYVAGDAFADLSVAIEDIPAENTDLTVADFTENAGTLVWTKASGEQFRIAFTTTPATGYYYQIYDGSAYGDASDVFSNSDDDAAYAAAVAAAVATYN